MNIHPQNELQLYLEKLRFHLNSVKIPNENDKYLNLGKCSKLNTNLLMEDKVSYCPLAEANSLMYDALNQRNLDKIMLGINEIFKTYIKIVNENNQEEATHEFMTRIKMIFKISLLNTKPFSNSLWLYVCKCIQTAAFFLLEKKYNNACKLFLEYTAAMGKTVVKEELRTDILQNFLVMFEINTRDNGFYELSDEAKNHRHNLET
jgi:hypothetical protein